MGLIPVHSPCATAILNLFNNQVRDVFIASAFLRIEAVAEMLARLLKARTDPCSLRVLTRGSLSDILAGASDLASLALLTNAPHSYLSIECRRDPRLHAKVYLVDFCKAIITSANLTPPGLNTNIEFGMFIDSPEIAKNIMNYFDPIWKMAERLDEKVLDDLSTGIGEGISDTLAEADRAFSEHVIRKKEPAKLRRPFAELPKTEVVKLSASWDRLDELGMDLESARARMVSGTLKRQSRQKVRKVLAYDKSKQLDIGSGNTISPEEVNLVSNVENLWLMMASPNWELRDAAAEALGNIIGDKATTALIEALQHEKDKFVLWSILISLKPRVSEQNLDQVLGLLQRTRDVHIMYSVYLIAATIKPQAYAGELIRHIPDINNNEYIEEVESALHGLCDGEFTELINNLKDWTDSFRKASLLFYLAKDRGDNIADQIQSIMFPHLQGSDTPIMDWVVDSLLQKDQIHMKTEWRREAARRKRFKEWLEREFSAKPKTPSGR